jgi:hypothetical protein
MKRFTHILILVASCSCGCRTSETNSDQVLYAEQLSILIETRDAWAQAGYVRGRAVLRTLLKDTSPHWELTLRDGIEWHRYSVPELKELIEEVKEQISFVRSDLTTHPKNWDANNQMQNIGTNAPNSDL